MTLTTLHYNKDTTKLACTCQLLLDLRNDHADMPETIFAYFAGTKAFIALCSFSAPLSRSPRSRLKGKHWLSFSCCNARQERGVRPTVVDVDSQTCIRQRVSNRKKGPTTHVRCGAPISPPFLRSNCSHSPPSQRAQSMTTFKNASPLSWRPRTSAVCSADPGW